MLRVQNVEKPFGDSLFASRQTTAMTAVFHSFIILTEICQDLLLNSNCSISKILTFTMPLQLRMAVTTTNIAYFVSGQLPTFTNKIGILKTWPIPSHNILHNIEKKAIKMHATSICYPHLLTSHPAQQLYFPLWVLTYWKELSLLCMYVIGPWRGPPQCPIALRICIVFAEGHKLCS